MMLKPLLFAFFSALSLTIYAFEKPGDNGALERQEATPFFMVTPQHLPYRCQQCEGTAYDFRVLVRQLEFLQSPDFPFKRMQQLLQITQSRPRCCHALLFHIEALKRTLAALWPRVSPAVIEQLRRDNQLTYEPDVPITSFVRY